MFLSYLFYTKSSANRPVDGLLRIFIRIVFDLECSRCKQTYIEYKSQSQGIRSLSLQTLQQTKQKRITIARQLPSGEKQREQLARSQKQRSHIYYLEQISKYCNLFDD